MASHFQSVLILDIEASDPYHNISASLATHASSEPFTISIL